MKRLLASLAATPLALLALAGPADAAKPEVTHTTYTTTIAEAYWSTGDGENYVEGSLSAALTSDGPQLSLWQLSALAEGGYVQTVLTGEGDYTFTMDKSRLRSAQLVSQGLVTETCTLDEEFNQVGDCALGSVDIDLLWTGEGAIRRGGYSEHYKGDGVMINLHVSHTSRDASAEGSITGAITVEDFGYASLGTYKTVETKRCVGSACQEPMQQ